MGPRLTETILLVAYRISGRLARIANIGWTVTLDCGLVSGAEDVQTPLAVTLPVVPSLYVAVAVHCCVEFLLMVTLAGVTAIETKVADAGAVTVKTAEPETQPTLALMFDVPTATAVTRPLPLTVATPLADVDQVALEVPSLVRAVAVGRRRRELHRRASHGGPVRGSRRDRRYGRCGRRRHGIGR